MAKRKPTHQGPSLFDVIDTSERQELLTRGPDFRRHPECPHKKRWVPGTTRWPGEHFERMTETCIDCGEIRGRVK